MKYFFRLSLVLTVVAAALVAACLPEVVSKFKEVGKFTSGSKDRIFAVVYQPQIALDELRVYGKKALNTSGRSTTVYFYRDGRAVPDGLTGSRSFEQASDAISQVNGFRYVFERGYDGIESFATCSDDPKPYLCLDASGG